MRSFVPRIQAAVLLCLAAAIAPAVGANADVVLREAVVAQAVVVAGPAAGAEKKKDAKPKVSFGAEAEAKFAEFLVKLREAKKKVWLAGVKTEVETVVKSTGLDADGAKTLEASGQKLVESSMDEWIEKIDGLFRQQANVSAEQMGEMLDQVFQMVDNYASMDLVPGYTAPLDRPAWSEAVKQTLSSAQHALWTGKETERQAAFKKEVGDFLTPQFEALKEAKATELDGRVADLKRLVTVSKEAGEKLQALVKTMANEAALEWRKRTEKGLLGMGAEQRRQALKSGNFFFGSGEEESGQQQDTWQEAIEKIVSPEELTLLKAAQESSLARRTRVMSAVTLSLLDDKVALNASQREKLQPILDRAIKGQPSLFPQGQSNNYYNFSAPMFFSAAASAPEAEVKALLDEHQWLHWKDTAVPQRPMARKVREPEKARPGARPVEIEDAENAISDYLHVRTTNQRKVLLAVLLLQTEDAARVTGLGPEAISRLQTAARGAVEETLEGWRSTLSQNLRSQMGDVSPQNVVQRIAAMPEYMVQTADRGESALKAVWLKALKVELSDAQRALWQKEVEERARFKEKAISSILLAEFDRKNGLAPGQWEKLEPLLDKSVKEYGKEITNMFSNAESNPWYLQNYMMFIPFVGIPEAELKGILGKEQWEQWTQSNEFGNCTSYFRNIEQMSKQRVKAAK